MGDGERCLLHFQLHPSGGKHSCMYGLIMRSVFAQLIYSVNNNYEDDDDGSTRNQGRLAQGRIHTGTNTLAEFPTFFFFFIFQIVYKFQQGGLNERAVE